MVMHKILLVLVLALLASCKEKPPRYNGYIDADLIYLSSSFPGRLNDLSVQRGQTVEKNQQLFKLEEINDRFAIEISELSQKNLLAQREELLNQIQYNQLNYNRIRKMRKNEAASQNELELARQNLEVLKNRLNALEFQVKSSQAHTEIKQWQKERKEGYAAQPGIVFDTYFTQDEYVQPGQPVVSLVTKEHIKAIFYVPEEQLGSIKLNSRVRISIDDKPEYGIGSINYVSPIAQYIPPILYSREERHNLVFRVEASLNNPNLEQIHLGQPVTLDIEP
jgi:HlyD family secretion protein